MRLKTNQVPRVSKNTLNGSGNLDEIKKALTVILGDIAWSIDHAALFAASQRKKAYFSVKFTLTPDKSGNVKLSRRTVSKKPLDKIKYAISDSGAKEICTFYADKGGSLRDQ